MSVKVIVEHRPTLAEIEETLAVCALDNDMNRVLPVQPGQNRAEKMQAGWCFLWYDAQSLCPLGYTYFEFFDKRGRKAPYFHLCPTRFLKPSHYRAIRPLVLRVFREALKNRVRAYIPYENKLALALAEDAGFTPIEITDKGILWEWAAAER